MATKKIQLKIVTKTSQGSKILKNKQLEAHQTNLGTHGINSDSLKVWC